MKIKIPKVRDLIREYTGGPVSGLSREEFRQLARKAINERDEVEFDVERGAFICDICGRKHYNVAPRGCRQAYAAGY